MCIRHHKFIVSLLLLLILQSTLIANSHLYEFFKSALQNNEQILIEKKKLQSAKARVTQVLSNYLPTISLSANLTKNYSSPIINEFTFGGVKTEVEFGFREPSVVKSWQANISQNLFTFGKIESQLNNALENLKVAEIDFELAKQELIFNLLSAYYKLLADKVSFDYAQKNYETVKAFYEKSLILKDKKRISELDFLKSKIALLSAEQMLTKTTDSLQLSITNLKNITDKDVDINDIDVNFPEVTEKMLFNEITIEAFENSLLLKKLKSNIKMSENNLISSYSNWLPSVVAQASYSWANTDYSTSKINYDQTNWNIVAALNWKIFDGFDIQSRIKESLLLKDITTLNLSQAQKKLNADLYEAFTKYQSSLKTKKIAFEILENSILALKSAEIRYKNNLISEADFLEEQNNLAKAEQDYVFSKLEATLSYFKLLFLMGKLDETIINEIGGLK